MSNYVLSCCSTADLTKEHFEERNINCVFFHYYLNDVEYADDLGQSMPFDKFYQADESHATEGSGIGLAVVKRIVVLHGGNVTVHSENHLNLFTVELPKGKKTR